MKLGGHFFSSSLFFLNKSQTILKTFWHQFYDSMQTSSYDKTNTNLSEKLVIQQTRVCSCAGDYQLRPEKFGCFQEFIIVNITCLWLKVMDTTNCQTSIVSLNTSKTQFAINDRYNKLLDKYCFSTHTKHSVSQTTNLQLIQCQSHFVQGWLYFQPKSSISRVSRPISELFICIFNYRVTVLGFDSVPPQTCRRKAGYNKTQLSNTAIVHLLKPC